MNRQRARINVRGAVQGVGFRPFVYRLAHELGLSGWVLNSPQGVSIEIEGPAEILESFRDRLQNERPRAAIINKVEFSLMDPLWTEEAMHRAYSLVNLTFALDRRAPLCHNDIVTARMEQALSRNIAACFRSLAISDDKKILPCSDALRIIVRNLVELFGLAAGQISLEMSIERLVLPAFKRRSLVSAASELVINALRHAFDAPSSGHITVGLCRLGLSDAKLSISDDGRGIRPGRYGPSGIAFDLAALLESDLLYSEAERGGTLAEITFPVGR